MIDRPASVLVVDVLLVASVSFATGPLTNPLLAALLAGIGSLAAALATSRGSPDGPGPAGDRRALLEEIR